MSLERGYNMKIAVVDLSSGETRELELRPSELRDYVGGASLAAYLTLRMVELPVDPYSPQNLLSFMAGPLTGTLAPCSGRHAVTAISPLTGGWGESTAGGRFGAALRSAGLDGLLVRGAAENPCYIYVEDGRVEVRDASHVWGEGTYRTQEILRSETDPKASVSCIGPAGENLVRFAAVMNDGGRAAGRTGMGAVMGSKKLKAVVVAGDGGVDAGSEEFKEEALRLHSELREALHAQMMREYGTAVYFEVGAELGDVPAKYFSRSDFPAEEVSGEALVERFRVEPTACFACPIGCGRKVLTNWGSVDGPEYEAIAALGPLNWVFDLEAIVRANHLCNDLGLDTISTGVVVAFSSHLKERGLLPTEFTRQAPDWGDAGRLIGLIEEIAKREGLGRILAEGVSRTAEILGVSREEAAAVKGLEVPMHDPRAFFGMALSYATSPRGACHLRGDFYSVDLGSFQDPDLGLSSGDRFSLRGRAREVAALQDLREVFNASLLCIFTNFTSSTLARLLSLITGWAYDPERVREVGERSFNLKRRINVLQGIGPGEDRLPEIVLRPLSEGGAAGKSPSDQLEDALREYYGVRGWPLPG